MKRRRWLLAGAAVLIVVTAAGGMIARSSAKDATPADQTHAAHTVKVTKGNLSAMVSLNGTLTYHARADGSPYAVINQARGTYTKLPDVGDKVDCGDVLYRVDDRPVLLLCGSVPAYRDLHTGDVGRDVRQLNRNLHELGDDHAAGIGIDPDDNDFTWKTEAALEKLQARNGLTVTGALDLDDAVILPRSLRIAKLAAEPGGSARPGTQVAQATSDRLQVQVDLEASQQGEVKQGDHAQITLPGNTSAKGRVDRLGRVAQTAGKDKNVEDATIPASISLDDPEAAHGLDEAPVQVDITTQGVQNALSVPVVALVGKSGGGFAVEVVRDSGQHRLIVVKLGLFDTAGGRVQVKGDLHEGDHVVVPSL